MTTSAQSLNQLMAAISGHPTPTDSVVTVLAEYLEFSGSDAEPRVVTCLYKLIKKIENDIENLPLDDVSKAQARSYIAPFQALTNFSQLHLDIGNARNNFLKPQNLVGLTNLHMAILGHIKDSDLDNDTKQLAEKFREISQEVCSSELPKRSKKIIIKRLTQISSILDHFYAFGAEDLQEEIEALVGAIVINPPTKSSKNNSIYTKIVTISIAVLVALKSIDSGLGTTLSVIDNGRKLIEVAQEAIGVNDDNPE